MFDQINNDHSSIEHPHLIAHIFQMGVVCVFHNIGQNASNGNKCSAVPTIHDRVASKLARWLTWFPPVFYWIACFQHHL